MRSRTGINITLLKDPLTVLGITVMTMFILMAVFANLIVTHDPLERIHVNGALARLFPPSSQYWFGTTYYGADVFSQTIMGSRVSVIVGLISAINTTLIGTVIGLISGYYGKWIDDILMRITDITYGIPVMAFAIILVAFLGPSIWNIILVISLLLWRTTARTIRSQVISIKERPFILSAIASGASDFRIMFIHILPNVLSLSLLYATLGIGDAVLAESGLSFLGLGDPLKGSWGQMLYYSFLSASIRRAWWWVIPPGVCISLFVMASYLIGRSYERTSIPQLRERIQ